MGRLSVNFVGCGKLGKTLATLFLRHNITIGGIVTTSLQGAHQIVHQLGAGIACESIADLPPADIYFIATPDDLVEQTAIALHQQGKIAAGNIIVHGSGTLSSTALSSVKQNHCLIASMHFLKSFADTQNAIATFAGTYCAIEGDEKALAILKPIFANMGINIFSVNNIDKKLCHVASVMANNYLVTLHAHAHQIFLAAGLSETMANQISSKLMQDALNNLSSQTHQQALTGPLQRGDINTIRQHIRSLSTSDLSPETRAIYHCLGKATLDLTSHTAPIYQALKEILN